MLCVFIIKGIFIHRRAFLCKFHSCEVRSHRGAQLTGDDERKQKSKEKNIDMEYVQWATLKSTSVSREATKQNTGEQNGKKWGGTMQHSSIIQPFIIILFIIITKYSFLELRSSSLTSGVPMTTSTFEGKSLKGRTGRGWSRERRKGGQLRKEVKHGTERRREAEQLACTGE